MLVNNNDWQPQETPDQIFLDNVYDKIAPGSYVVIRKLRQDPPSILKIDSVDVVPRTAYGISAKTTLLKLANGESWFDPTTNPITMDTIRQTAILAQSEPLELAEEPITDVIGGDKIELDGLYDGIQSGCWIIVAGERTDIPGTSGVMDSELVMVANSEQPIPKFSGDTIHTVLDLTQSLVHEYKRDTVTIYGNVVKATQGQTRTEVLGSGDGSQTLQEFSLMQSPLTYVSAPTANGIQSTLQVWVNNILWHEADSFEGLLPTDRKFITSTDETGKITIISGNGLEGARLPTGVENINALYRTGIGSSGNVKAGQISLLATKPLGVKSVINPMEASGGVDTETRDQARGNAPLITMSLDRLVSVDDYGDFARTFAGIGKADAEIIMDGSRQLMHLTIAGANDIPIDESSDLYQNLKTALKKYGDPFQPVLIAVRELLGIQLTASVKLLPDYSWDTTEPVIRAALLDAFSFDRRELGQNVYLSEVISVIQNSEGVDYTTITCFNTLSQDSVLNMMKNPEFKLLNLTPPQWIEVQPARVDPTDTAPAKRILPAQLAYILPDVPEMLILNEVTT